MIFDRQRAEAYDAQFAKLSPMRESLHFCARMVLSELPDSAHILCVGAGTGTELIALAHANPGWRFTALDPSAPMLEVCRRRVQAEGIEARCTFHAGYLASLAAQQFDAATCFLVSHFMVDETARRDFFRQIADRLCPGGYLVNAGLASDTNDPGFEQLLEVWLRTLGSADVPKAMVENFRAGIGERISVLPPARVASIIESGGFEPPVLFCQTLLIHAWFSRKR